MVKKQNGSQNHSKTGFKICPKNDHSNTGQSGIRWFTVYQIIINFQIQSPWLMYLTLQLQGPWYDYWTCLRNWTFNINCLLVAQNSVQWGSVLRFTNFETLLSLSSTITFPIKNSDRRKKCDSRAWWISALNFNY